MMEQWKITFLCANKNIDMKMATVHLRALKKLISNETLEMEKKNKLFFGNSIYQAYLCAFLRRELFQFRLN
jgi:hypothetical protein